MGLCVIVGVSAEEDDEVIQALRSEFAKVNRLLRARNLPEHAEPLELGEVLSLDMYGYSGLHYLRRVAAHTWAGNPLPPPGDRATVGGNKDPIVNQYYASLDKPAEAGRPRLFRRAPAKSSPPMFEHLMNHGDAEGFYIPIEFDRVIADTAGLGIPGGLVGSTQRLLAECTHLAGLLELPADMDPESDELWKATEHQGQGETKWRRYGIESFTCSRLLAACRASLENRAAIVFS